MGEYFKPMNLDKKEYIHPHKLGSGLKLWEQAAARHSVGAALILLLQERWKGCKISLESDYDSGGHYFDESFTDISDMVAGWLEEAFDGTFTGDGWRTFTPNSK